MKLDFHVCFTALPLWPKYDGLALVLAVMLLAEALRNLK